MRLPPGCCRSRVSASASASRRRSHLDVAGEHGTQQLVETASDLPLEPTLSTPWGLEHRDVQDDRDHAVTLGGLARETGRRSPGRSDGCDVKETPA